MSLAPRMLACASLALFSLAASATVTTYTSPSSFLSQVQPGSYTETFTGLPDDAPTSFSGNGFGYTVSAASGVYGGGDQLSTNQPYETLTLTFTGNPVTAVGGNFFAVDLNNVLVPSTITVTLSDNTMVSFNSTTMADSYFGFTSDSLAITSLTITAGNVPFNSLYPALDNLTVGQVPEPATLLMLSMGMGMATLLVLRRAR